MTSQNKSTTSISIVTSGNQVTVFQPPDLKTTFTSKPYPESFIEWQSKSRIQMFSHLLHSGAVSVRSQPAHLPILATLGTGEFPINLASRGIGLLPRKELLEEYCLQLNIAKKEAEGKGWEESLPSRVNAMSQFYNNIEGIDPMLLGGLEIFEGKTANNSRANPHVSLLYTGEPPDYPSFQFNCIAEIIPPTDQRFKFLLAARELFAFDAFHITQTRYPFGYVFHLIEVLEKTPYPRR
jgi:hypothetical protein